jgi:hypothetical protein
MPDITMCEGQGCPLKESCYRFTATASSMRQAYFIDSPYNKGQKACKYYWDNGKNKKILDL